ncbi:transporter [Lysobacter enzymogenes]|uniref:transporter n=1 Tax=Lysobacter enzymogenes TaxID=69 RepID=UPI00099B808F|nr:transporter [Lysobacter enzymogenes]UZW60715.1 transporter [Lysobacter enzymogenes]
MRAAPLSLILAATLAAPAHAAEASASDGAPSDEAASDPSSSPPPFASLHQRMLEMSRELAAQRAEIERLRGEVDELELAGRGRGLGPAQTAAPDGAQQGAPRDARELAQDARRKAADDARGEGPTDPGNSGDGAAPVQIGQAQRDEDAQRREQEKALVVREHAPLFERRFTFDAGISYSYYDRRQLALSGFLALDAIFLGSINLDQTKASIGTVELSGRYGLSDRLSVEASLPYVYRDSRFVSGGAGGASSVVSEVRMRSQGLGDASVAAYYQWVKESQRWPDIVTSLRVRAPTGRDPFGLKLVQPDADNNNLNIPEDLPTGSGVWAATFNVSALRTYDPVILFGNLGYTYNQPRDFDDISPVAEQVSPARVALGNTVQLSGGLAIALNDRSAVSFSVASATTGATHTTAPGARKRRVAGSSSNSTTFNIGASYVLPSGWTFNGQLAAGLTPDAPNFVFSLRGSRSF